MISNYIKTAFRNLIRNKTYSFLNILGLAVGMGVCVLILLYIQHELSYDKYHRYGDRIYRVSRTYLDGDGSVQSELASVAPSFIPLLEESFPEIEHCARLYKGKDNVLRYEEKSFIETRLYYAEDDIFEVFTIPFISGDPESALTDPLTMVISESTARKYFGDEDPLGKMIIMDNKNAFKVTGIMEDVPENTHFHFDILVSYLTLKDLGNGRISEYFFGRNNFSDNVCRAYLRLAEGFDGEALESKIPAMLDDHFGERHYENGGIYHVSEYVHLDIMKVSDIHLHSHKYNEIEPNGDIRYVALFTLIAVFILLIACINFVNLATARAATRAKEVGLRKVIGASRGKLVVQFISESILIALFSLVLALVMVEVVLPYFNSFLGYEQRLDLLSNPVAPIIILLVLLITGAAAGLYPAFYLSNFKPVTILRGELTRGKRGALIRKSLVIFQFVISIILLICLTVIFRQMRYIQGIDLGYDKENVLLVPADAAIVDKWKEVKDELLRSPGIIAATASKRSPSGILADAPGFRTEVYGKVMENNVHMPHIRTEHDFIKTYGIEIIAGRDFSAEFPTDSTRAFIINETAVRELGWKTPQDAIGAPMRADGRDGKIIGVVRDFKYESLHSRVVSMLIYVAPEQSTVISIRIAPGNIRERINTIQDAWNKFHPGCPLRYTFLDEKLNQLYESENRMMLMFAYFSLLAILIACLGLIGLAAYATAQRTKEIGVRKVLGASVSKIVMMMSGEFMKWVIIANLIAWPIAYLAMRGWLENFAYRIELGIFVFIFSGFIALAIAILTVSIQTIKAAVADPIEALRHE